MQKIVKPIGARPHENGDRATDAGGAGDLVRGGRGLTALLATKTPRPPQGKPLGGWRHKPSVFATHKLSRVRAPFPRRSQSQSHSKNPAGHKGIGYAPWDWWAICDCQRTDKGCYGFHAHGKVVREVVLNGEHHKPPSPSRI